MRDVMLSTIDNPWDPFDNYKEWFYWDATHGYHSPGLLARIAYSSDELSEKDLLVENERAIDEIISDNYSGMHIKIVRDRPKKTVQES